MCKGLNRSLVVGAVAALLVVGLPGINGQAEAGGLSKALVGRVFQRDLQRHAVTPAGPLPAPRTVHRYTTEAQAKKELRHGLAPDTHMTPNAPAGRPLSPQAAQKRYGLPKSPEVRETIVLPPGHPVRHNKALAGEPGRGELTSPTTVPPQAIRRVVPLQH